VAIFDRVFVSSVDEEVELLSIQDPVDNTMSNGFLGLLFLVISRIDI